MKRSLKILGIMSMGALMLTGCEDRVRTSVEEQIAARAESGNAEVAALFKQRDEGIAADLAERVGYISKIQEAREKLTLSLDRIPGEQEIATEAALSVEKVKEYGGASGSGHPLVAWRKSLINSDVKTDVASREKKYPGTFLESLLSAYSTFMAAQDRYWDGSMDMEEYAPFLTDYAQDAIQTDCGLGKSCSHSRRCVEGKCEGSPFLDDALFDWVFLHMQHLYYSKRLPEDTRATSHLRYWQLALGMQSETREGFKNFIHRLCETYALKPLVQKVADELKSEDPLKIAEEVKAKAGIALSEDAVFAALSLNTSCGGGEEVAAAFACLPLPDEFRAKAVMQPYYDQLICRLDALKAGNTESPFLSAVAVMKRQLQAMKAEYPLERMVEYPLLPETTSMYDASQRLVFEIGPLGAFLGQGRDPFSDSAAGRIALTELAEGETFALNSGNMKEIREAFLTNLKTIRLEGDPALRQGLISLQADGTYSALTLLSLATATTRLEEEEYANTLNQEVWLAGRRRVDGRNSRRATQMQLLSKDKLMKLNLNVVGSKVACTVVGFTGDAPVDEMPAPVAAVMVDGEGITMGALADGSTMGEADGSSPNAELNFAALSEWANKQMGPIVLGVRGGATWNDMMRPLGPLSFKCVDPACRMGEFRTKPNVYISYCK